MDTSETSPIISSFVIRFVHPESSQINGADTGTSGGAISFRGAIRHIQTDQELVFTRWDDAVAFIQRFVPLFPQNGSLETDETSAKI